MRRDEMSFTGRTLKMPPPMRTLRRFTKPGGHIAEIRERTVTTFRAIEFIVYVDGSLLETELFHGERLRQYQAALDARITQFTDGGWIEVGEAIPDDENRKDQPS